MSNINLNIIRCIRDQYLLLVEAVDTAAINLHAVSLFHSSQNHTNSTPVYAFILFYLF